MSQATPIASLQVLFEAQTAQFQAGVGQVINSINKSNAQFKASVEPMNKMNKGFQAIGTSLKTLAGSFVILEAFSKAVQGLTQADDVVDTARAYGTFSTNILALQKALMTAGGSGDEFTGMLTRLTGKIDDALQGNEASIKSFQRLGISVQELSKLNLTEQFARISEALGGMEDKTQAVAIGTEIFGRKLAGIQWESFNTSIRDYLKFTDALKIAVNEAGGDISKLTEEQQKFISTWEGYEYAATYIDRFKLAVKKLSTSLISELGWGLAKTEASFAGLQAFVSELTGGFNLFTEITQRLNGVLGLLSSDKGINGFSNLLSKMFPESTKKAAEAYNEVLSRFSEEVRSSNQAIADQEHKVNSVGRAFKTAGDLVMENFVKGLNDGLLAMNLLPQQIAYVEKEIRALGNTSDLTAEQLTKLKYLQEEHLKLSEKLDGADPMKKWADGLFQTAQGIDLIPQKIATLNEAFSLGFIGINQYTKELEALNAEVQTASQKSFGDFQVALTGFGTEFGNKFIDNIRAGKDAFSGFMEDITNMILKFMMNRMVTQFMTSMFGGAPGSATAAAGKPSWWPFAKGGAFGGGTGLPYGVYDKPTFFSFDGSGLHKFAKGGVLGEAGPEAIMPLRRGGDGKLGVSAAPVNIEINNYSSAKVEAAETTNEDGSKRIVMTIRSVVKDMFGDGSMDKTMKVGYGLSRAAA